MSSLDGPILEEVCPRGFSKKSVYFDRVFFRYVNVTCLEKIAGRKGPALVDPVHEVRRGYALST